MYADCEPGGYAPVGDPDGRDGEGGFAAGTGGGDSGDDTEDGGGVSGVTAGPDTVSYGWFEDWKLCSRPSFFARSRNKNSIIL